MIRIDHTIKKMLPRSLLGRAVLIIVTPLILLQLVSAAVFYESHWDKVSRRLALGMAGDVASVVELFNEDGAPISRERVSNIAERHMGININFREGEIMSNRQTEQDGGIVDKLLIRALNERLNRPFTVDTTTVDRHVVVSVQLPNGILELTSSRKRLFSSTTYIFVIWMVGTAMVLFGVAAIFMRNQVRPIRRLARAADNFGKGREAPNFKPEGATEVRRAAAAFIAMKERIQRQINQRTDMLAGVSHDLRTPLTRMKLQLALLGDVAQAEDMKQDVAEMEHMLEGYLAFARGEGDETPRPTDLRAMLGEVVGLAKRHGAAVDLHTEGSLEVMARPNAFKRCVTNLVENADRYGDHVSVRAGVRGDAIEIIIDDDGPGIPEDKREEAFKPFIRLENSRNRDTGGVGLGLSIARDIVRSHGGDLSLADSPSGGLRARLTMPI
ncbi:MAG: ATP-binding protein [Proteobacteria bacterium]|nr:ATP-binding protein [Pseudomonadota bacterium]